MTPSPNPPRDFTIWVLMGFVLFFTLATIAVSLWVPMNDKVYALLAPQVGVFSGALLLWLKPKS